MNLAEQQYQQTYAGPHNEAYFARMAELGDTPEPINGGTPALHVVAPRPSLAALADYLNEVERYARRFVAFPSEHEPVAVTLWVAHAWLIDLIEVSPILSITSPEMRSGKTRLLDVLEQLVPHPFRAITPSEATLYTVLDQKPKRTLLLDEADAIFGPRSAERYEGHRAILNAGNRRGTTVPRVSMQGQRRIVEEFNVFGPKAIAGIGSLPSTVADRAIPVRMRRRAATEPVERFRLRQVEREANAIRLDLDAIDALPEPHVPDELNDRAADSWEPLLAIAEVAGGMWPVRARAAALAVSADEELPASVGVKLLADIREAFDDAKQMPTADLLAALHAMEEAPWGEWYGKPLTARGLAKLLEPYRVRPQNRRIDGEMRRGYFRADLEDPWARYVLSLPGTVSSVSSVSATADEPFRKRIGDLPAPHGETEETEETVPRAVAQEPGLWPTAETDTTPVPVEADYPASAYAPEEGQ